MIFIFNSCTNSKKTDIGTVSQIEKKATNSLEKKERFTTEKIREFISRKWIINEIEYNDKTLSFKNFDNPEKDILNKFIVEFLDNGDLNFENTTKQYLCGNGIPYFDKAKWEFKKGLYNPTTNDFELTNNLILHIRGREMLENRFEFKREYLIKSISENGIELEQVNSILEKFITDGNNFYKE
ncbi:DUF4468 domain-containing protein [Tenacibaculum insulae]